ncbi:PocR ligand-binding domain-containing protein [Desulfitibacter alkalitolerans]|uniref:PocR ligand-binding domain-containing protein n=1 Tax=Desulfitibacter alkalitolerans TaxID=264641 RepID=UPI0004827806|nr:PocR ligand-binding domain-containing protein [Desulfitibacter alkalitolerans]
MSDREQEELTVRTELNQLVMDYSYSTKINCKAFNEDGTMIVSSNFPKMQLQFCQFIYEAVGSSRCHKSYIYGAKQSEKYGDAYIYYCPFGLVNWTVPIIRRRDANLYLIGGPILIHQVDTMLLEQIHQVSPPLKQREEEIELLLNDIRFIEPRRVRYLADLLLRISKSLMDTDFLRINDIREDNIFKSQLVDNICTLKKFSKVELQDTTSYLKSKEADVISKLKAGNILGAKEVLNHILGYIFYESLDNMDIIKWKASQLVIILAQIFSELGAEMKNISNIKLKYLDKILKANNINELSMHMLSIFDHYSDAIIPVINIKNKEVILIAINYMKNNFHNNISLHEVAVKVGMHPVNFSKLFKKETGRSFPDYLNIIRIEASKDLLKKNLPLVDVAVLVGYNDQSYFSKIFKKFQGLTPKEWQKNKGITY